MTSKSSYLLNAAYVCRPWLAPLAFTGRMPLTNYLLQSVVCTLIFYGYGLGFYMKCGPALGLTLSFGIFSLQIPWSRWWFDIR